MKVFGKWLVLGNIGKIDGVDIVASSFMTRKDAVDGLETSGFRRLSDNEWEDSLGRRFHIEKNTKEWKW